MSRSWWSEYLPPSGDGRKFAAAALTDSIGTGFYIAGGTVFFVRVVGLSATQVGLGLMVTALVGFTAAVPVGSLVSRLGPVRAMQLLQLWRGCWFGALALVHGLPAFLVVLSLMSLAQGPVSPMTQLVVGGIVDDENRTRTMASVRSVRNVGFSLGALAAVPLLSIGSARACTWIIVANCLSFFAAAALLHLIRTPVPAQARPPGRWFSAVTRLGDRRYLWFTTVNGLMCLHGSILTVGLPLVVLSTGTVPPWTLGVLVTLNTVLAVTMQVRFARGIDSTRAASRALRNAGLSLTLCCAILSVVGFAGTAGGFALLLVAIVSLTFGEMWQAVGGWELSFREAPEDRRTQYILVYNLGFQAETIVGPFLVALVVSGGRSSGWLIAALGFGLAAVAASRLAPMFERAHTGVPRTAGAYAE
jgi:MFS family permease